MVSRRPRRDELQQHKSASFELISLAVARISVPSNSLPSVIHCVARHRQERRQEARRRVVSEHGTSREIAKKAVLVLDRGPVKYPSMPNQLPPIPTAGGGLEDQQMPCFGSREELGGPLRSQLPGRCPRRFFFRRAGRSTPRPLAEYGTGHRPASWGPLLQPSLQRGRKRTRGNGTRGAVRPGGLRRCSKEQRRSAAKEAATACSDEWRLAELQQGSTLQLPSYYPIVGGEAGNMRYAIYSPKASPHPRYIHPLCASAPQAP